MLCFHNETLLSPPDTASMLPEIDQLTCQTTSSKVSRVLGVQLDPSLVQIMTLRSCEQLAIMVLFEPMDGAQATSRFTKLKTSITDGCVTNNNANVGIAFVLKCYRAMNSCSRLCNQTYCFNLPHQPQQASSPFLPCQHSLCLTSRRSMQCGPISIFY